MSRRSEGERKSVGLPSSGQLWGMLTIFAVSMALAQVFAAAIQTTLTEGIRAIKVWTLIRASIQGAFAAVAVGLGLWHFVIDPRSELADGRRTTPTRPNTSEARPRDGAAPIPGRYPDDDAGDPVNGHRLQPSL